MLGRDNTRKCEDSAEFAKRSLADFKSDNISYINIQHTALSYGFVKYLVGHLLIFKNHDFVSSYMTTESVFSSYRWFPENEFCKEELYFPIQM